MKNILSLAAVMTLAFGVVGCAPPSTDDVDISIDEGTAVVESNGTLGSETPGSNATMGSETPGGETP